MSEGADRAVIAGVGMMTAVGLSAEETAASVRTGTMRFAESSIVDRRLQPLTLAEVPEDGLPDLAEPLRTPGLTGREARLLRLATMPLLACAAQLPVRLRPLPVALALPETATTRPLDGRRFIDALAAQLPGVVEVGRSVASFRGRSGGVAAIGRAADAVRAGRVDFIVAGGVDTYRDPYVLAMLDREGRVKSEQNLDGFIPGEGAGFLLLANVDAARRAGLSPLATIAGWAEAVEPGHLYSEQPYRGDGLASAIRQAVAVGGAAGPIAEVYSSMNGESHWAKEWGVGFMRSSGAFADGHGMHHPADCYGDTGAAAGPLMAALAALAISGEAHRSPVLVYGSSDRGERAVLVMTA